MPYQPLQLRPRDPRPETELESASSGLTPFIGRTTLSTTPPLAGHYSGSASLRDLVPPVRQYEPFINGSLPLINVPPINK
jgi:hypothetical protein